MPSILHRFFRECRFLLLLATPIVLAQLSHMAMGFVDTVMAGRVSPDDLAAVAIGSSIWMPVYLALAGILMALTPMVAHHYGAGVYRAIAPVLRQGLWLALVLGIGSFFLLRHMAPLMGIMDIEPKVEQLTLDYLRAIAWGFPPLVLYQALRSFSEGLSITRPIMVIGLLGLVLNIPANYIFIYGKLGFPAMGGVGCGWASALVMWFLCLGMGAWILRSRGYRFLPALLQLEWPALRQQWRIVWLGAPIGIAFFVETSMFAVIALLVASLGATVVAGHQIALNFTSLLFMVPLSISMAITIRVGQLVGAGEAHQARFSAISGIVITLGTALLFSSTIFALAPQIARMYSPDPTVQAMAVTLLLLAAIFQISDALQVSAAGGLRGYKDTRIPMLITFVAFWGIGLPLGYGLGLSSWLLEPLGAAGFWIGLVAGLSAAALMQGLRLYRVSRLHLHS